MVNKIQWEKIQHLIAAGIREGAALVTGGEGLPSGLTKGFYVKPTIFANVTNDMTIAREENVRTSVVHPWLRERR